MRILIVHPQFLEIGGAEKSMLGLYEELKKRFECELLYEFWKGHEKREYFLRSKVWKVVSLIYRFPKMLFSKEVRKKIIKSDTIIISITGNLIIAPLNWTCLIFSKIYQKKKIVYIHEPLLTFWGLTKFENIILSPLRYFDIFLFRIFKPNVIISNSDFSKEIVIKNYKVNNVKVIYPLFHLS